MADTTAAQPAALQRRMAAMKVEQEKERERLEDARRRAQSAGESVEAQLNIARDENEGLRSELRIAEAARDDARRSVDVSIEKQVDLKRDLRSALSELEVPAPLSAPLPRRPICTFLHASALRAPSTRLQTLRLELSLLRPYDVKPLPTTAAQLEHPELQPSPRYIFTGPAASPRGGGSSVGARLRPQSRIPGPTPNLAPYPNPPAQPKPKPDAGARPSTAYGHTGAGSAYGQRPGMLRSAAPRSQTLSPNPRPPLPPSSPQSPRPPAKWAGNSSRPPHTPSATSTNTTTTHTYHHKPTHTITSRCHGRRLVLTLARTPPSSGAHCHPHLHPLTLTLTSPSLSHRRGLPPELCRLDRVTRHGLGRRRLGRWWRAGSVGAAAPLAAEGERTDGRRHRLATPADAARRHAARRHTAQPGEAPTAD